MDTSLLTNISQKIKTQSRNKLYFDKYEYCLQFYFPELSSIRERTHSGVDNALNARTWARQINFGGSWRYNNRIGPDITDELRADCHLLCTFFIELVNDHKLIISCDTGYFYTNHLQDITDLLNYPQVMMEQLKQAITDIPANSIVLKSSAHSLRTYFKSQHLANNEQKDNLRNILYNQKNIRLGPSFSEWFTRYEFSKYIADNYFIDHNDMGILTLVSLACPIKIKNTLTIIRDK